MVGCHIKIVRLNVTVNGNQFSYIFLGARDPNDSQWPRLVRETLIRPRHAICRMCTHRGKLEEMIFTAAKHGKCVIND